MATMPHINQVAVIVTSAQAPPNAREPSGFLKMRWRSTAFNVSRPLLVN